MSTQLQKLQEIIKISTDSLSKEDFLSNFKIIVDLIKKLKVTNQEEMDTLKSNSQTVIENTKQEAMNYCLQEMTKFAKTIDLKLATIKNGEPGKDADVKEVANLAATMTQEALKPLIPTILQLALEIPQLGKPIRDALELLPDEEKLEIAAIHNLREELDKLEKKIGGGQGNVMGGAVYRQNLPTGWLVPTGVKNGVNLAFTVPDRLLDNSGEVYINGQAYYDFTYSGLTFTLTDAPASTDDIRVKGLKA